MKPWEFFIHLTFKRRRLEGPVREDEAKAYYREFLKRLAKHCSVHVTLAAGSGYQGNGNHHLHALISPHWSERRNGPSKLTTRVIEEIWASVAPCTGHSKVERYNPDEAGAYYLTQHEVSYHTACPRHLTDPAWTALKAWREQTRSFERENDRIVPHVFHRDGERVKSFRGAWKTACEKIGHPDFLFHDLRRCAARNYTRAGVQEAVAMKAMGQKTRQIFDRYNIAAEADLKDAAAKVTRFNSGANLGQAADSPQKATEETTVSS